MNTTLTIMRPGQPDEVLERDLPAQPGYDVLKALLTPMLDGAKHLERVAVLHDGKATDMFVDEDFQEKRLPRNEPATKIYRHNWMKRHPHQDPEELAYICGPAILFSRRVWF